MIYKTYIPHPQLAPFVKCYWRLEAPATNKDARERVFPDGCVELVFHLGDLFLKHPASGGRHIQPRAFVHGQLHRFMDIEPTGHTSIFAIRFQPHGLGAFLPMPVHEITGLTPTLTECWSHEGRLLEEQIANALTDAERITLIESFLTRKLDKHPSAYVSLSWCVSHILGNGGHTRIDALATTLNVSRRQLERRFITSIGLHPKQLSRIARFQAALRQLEQRAFTSLTQVAYDNGFHDQAHFIRDFQDFTGLSPKQYMAADLELVKYFAEE